MMRNTVKDRHNVMYYTRVEDDHDDEVAAEYPLGLTRHVSRTTTQP